MAKPKVNKIFLLIDGELSTELLSRQTRLWESLWKVSGELDNSEAKLVAILYPPLPLPGEENRLRWEPFPWLSTFPSLYQALGVVDLTSAEQGVRNYSC